MFSFEFIDIFLCINSLISVCPFVPLRIENQIGFTELFSGLDSLAHQMNKLPFPSSMLLQANPQS